MGASLQRCAAIVLRQVYLVRGSVARLVPLFAWVGVDMLLWGFITRYLNAVSHAGLDFVGAPGDPVLAVAAGRVRSVRRPVA